MDPTRKLYPQEDQPEAGRVGAAAEPSSFNLDAMLIQVLFVVLAVLGDSGLVL